MTEKKDPVELAIEKAKPILSKLTFGTVMGYCSGYAMKSVGKALAVVIGLGFIALQSAASTGYIDVNWNKIRDDAIKEADATGDGKLDVDDVKAYWKKLRVVLTDKIPGAGGFSLGFFYGVKHG